jgi:hypothetical protein
MDVAGVWRDHTFRMSCLLFVALPLFEAIWVATTADVHFQVRSLTHSLTR